MISHRLCAAVLVLAYLCVNAAIARSQGQRPVTVSVAPQTIHPGDVARLDISGATGREPFSATLLGQRPDFHYDDTHQQWRALVGVDLDTKPGAYSVRVLRGDGTTAATGSLRVAPKQFRVRRLRVSNDFVNPPQDALEKIAADNKVLSEAYARTSPKQWTGAFLLPVDGKPTSNFGTRSYYNGRRRAPHAGVDFVGGTGTPVRAANHGLVAMAAPMYFTGNTVVVDHGERLISVFAHLSEMRVEAGDVVEPGTIVGLVGATGRVTGPHLHWSVRLNGTRVDPLSLVALTAE